MKMDEIMDLIRELSYSQGCWGRLLRLIEEMDEDEYNEYKEELEGKNFKDNLDCILYLEGNA